MRSRPPFFGLPHLSDVVIDTDERIQQSFLRDNAGILRQLVDERIAEMNMRRNFVF